MFSNMFRAIAMKLQSLISDRFGKERAALYDAELEYLIERGYIEKDVCDFLETYASPVGIFDILSMFTRSRLSVKDLEKSLIFLFNRHAIIAEILSDYLEPNSKILDFGCGRGLGACSLALRGFEVHGVDVSADAIKIAERLADKLNCKSDFHLIKEIKLPFPDTYFDAALCVWTLHEIPHEQIQKLSSELHRVLHEMGMMFIIDQEGVAQFEIIKNFMKQSGFKLELEKSISLVYDHGKVSQAVMLKYGKTT